MKYLLFLTSVLFVFLNSCKEPQPRKPINENKRFEREYTIDSDRTKKKLDLEYLAIDKYILKDSTNTYINSTKGFKYCYLKKDSLNKPTPNYSDELLYNYNVTDIGNNIIYSKKQIGERTYFVDQESNIIEGLRQGLKLIKVGEEIRFIFPSQLAYGYRGDGLKIRPNIPLIYNVTLLNISKSQTKNIK